MAARTAAVERGGGQAAGRPGLGGATPSRLSACPCGAAATAGWAARVSVIHAPDPDTKWASIPVQTEYAASS